MSITNYWQLGLLAFFALGLLDSSNAITKEEETKINAGIEAGKTFTSVLQTGSFTEVLKSMTETIVPWVDAIGIFGDVLGFFLPEENEMLEEMKKGFEEVNKRLDAIKDEITEVKEAIDWATVKIEFSDIETRIRILDEKLKEVHMAPNPNHGKEEYIRVYEDQYDASGLKLYDAIVHNDQVFSENILTAGMKYTDYWRIPNQDHMRGLIALMMKASNIEISYQEFMEHDRGMEAIWKLRLEECKDAMEQADKKLEDAWKDLFRNEVNELAEDLKGTSHTDFRDVTYAFLNQKYYWRHWFVLSYDDSCRGWNKHSISYYATYVYVQFGYQGRNFIVATSDDSLNFDKTLATSYLRDYTCTASSSDCRNNAALKLTNAAPFHGVMQAAISRYCGWAVSSITTRSAWKKDIRLIKDSWHEKFTLFYFG